MQLTFDIANETLMAPCSKSNQRKITSPIPSLIKWTGSKRSQAYTIASYAPPHNRYFEPFIGSGAVLYLMGKPGSVAGDIYKPLIELWRVIQTSPDSLTENYRRQWRLLQDDFPHYYYEARQRFNADQNPFDLNFLLRTCVNGIVRFNSEGRFNNSFHLSRSGMTPDRFAAVVNQWHKVAKEIRYVCGDYAQVVGEAKRGDFIYLDPPYLGSKQRYIQNIDMTRFLSVLENLNSREVKWALSFDGRRGGRELAEPIPSELYKRHHHIASGNSAVGKVLNGPVEMVEESLYLNY